MTKEELKKEAINRVDAFIDSFSQDIRSTLYDRLNQEDVKDFLYSLYIDSAEPREKQIEEFKMALGSLRTFSNEQAISIEKLKEENAELKENNGKLLESCTGATMMYEHLTKAKEIIKGLCDLIHYKHGYFHKEIIDAEQFLKDVEK